MKTLILMRHAKSAWDDPQQKDIDRPLSARGRKAAPRMGAWLEAEKYRPDVVLCSTARRAHDTLDLVKPHLPKTATIHHLRGLYMASPREMLSEVSKMPASAHIAILVGHNPGMESLASMLTGSGNAKAIASLHSKFPTASIAVLRFDTDHWNELEAGTGTLLAFTRPRDLD